MKLQPQDILLMEKARQAIGKVYREGSFRHTVGAALRCKNGNIYTGVNVDALHGSCAEFVAMGAAKGAGEEEFDCMVAVSALRKDLALSPCGNCRQMLFEYAPNCHVIVPTPQGLMKLTAKDLLPFAYVCPY